jgi:hypothetical protein
VYLNDNHLISLPETIANLSGLSEINVMNNALCAPALSTNLVDFIDSHYDVNNGSWKLNQDRTFCDSDSDTFLDPADNCPFVANADQADNNNGDGIGDACDCNDNQCTLEKDIRGDHICQSIEPSCPPQPFSCDDVSDVSPVECEALVDLYNSTDGDNRENKGSRLGN